MAAFRLAAATLFALALGATALAEPIAHRTGVAPGEAIPTGGSFSIRFPVSFNDYELNDPGPPALVVHLLSGVDDGGLRFSATEIPVQGPPKPLDTFMEAAQKRPGASVSDVQREQGDGVETLSFSLTEPKSGSFMRMIRTRTTGYVLVVQFPNAMFSKASRMKDDYFNSFKMTRP